MYAERTQSNDRENDSSLPPAALVYGPKSSVSCPFNCASDERYGTYLSALYFVESSDCLYGDIAITVLSPCEYHSRTRLSPSTSTTFMLEASVTSRCNAGSAASSLADETSGADFFDSVPPSMCTSDASMSKKLSLPEPDFVMVPPSTESVPTVASPDLTSTTASPVATTFATSGDLRSLNRAYPGASLFSHFRIRYADASRSSSSDNMRRYATNSPSRMPPEPHAVAPMLPDELLPGV